jgi:hypothetical protein
MKAALLISLNHTCLFQVWITCSCVDVSAQLADVLAESDALSRANLLRNRRQDMARQAEDASRGCRCEVQEMWPGKSYVRRHLPASYTCSCNSCPQVLFTYERLRDVRIVYVPALSLGNFGGESDNFEWPRHTADFALLRAYVSPSGASSAFSHSNVPYRPRRHLQLSPSGAAPGDFVFLLGFPGSTMRYAPSCRLQYNDTVVVPELLQNFGAKIALMKKHTLGNRQAGLKVAAAIKSLSNEYKRSQGKRVMMRKLALVRERTEEEERLCAVAPQTRAILHRLQEIYDAFTADHLVQAALEMMRGLSHGSTWLAVAHAVHEAQVGYCVAVMMIA